MLKIYKFFLALCILIFSASTYVHAKAGDTYVSLSYASGSGDLKLAGTTYDIDLDQTDIGLTTYMDSNLYFSGSIMTGELTLAGIDIDADATRFGLGFYDGDLDYITGSGEQFKFGLTVSDTEVTLGAISSSETTYNVGFDNSFGMGGGTIFHFGFDTDTGDLFSDNSYYGSFTKSYGSAIFELGLNYNIYVTDALNSGDSTYVFFGVGTVF